MATTFETPADWKRPWASTWVTRTGSRLPKTASTSSPTRPATTSGIHTDPVRAKSGPFGTTIAHGYLTQSLVNLFLPQIVEVRGISMGINYGTDKVRFPAPVPVNREDSRAAPS